jgi:hypothetical protein
LRDVDELDRIDIRAQLVGIGHSARQHQAVVVVGIRLAHGLVRGEDVALDPEPEERKPAASLIQRPAG